MQRSVHDQYAFERESSDNVHDSSNKEPWDNTDGWDDRNSGRQSTYEKTGLRLVVEKSRVLHNRRVAVIDGYSEVRLGRDNPVSNEIPRIRLKEMEVSKFHASVYWDRAWEGWAVVDMGSKHGTYIHSSNLAQGSAQNQRLSSSKTASAPRRLRHLDHLTVGTTVFIVHIHGDRLACEQCSLGLDSGEIPLFPFRQKPNHVHAADHRKPSSHEPMRPQPRVAMSQLKHELLCNSMGQSPQCNLTQTSRSSHYIDRSARRRAMYSASSADAPGVSSGSPLSVPKPYESSESMSEPISAPEVSISESSIGHRILIKQGWHPGRPLGNAETGLTEPSVNINFNYDRSGLGSKG
ncbi:hypothetical protein F5878DRAFT_591714 [Lentinula raphanica]|uniref:SMAD/FHA domain-containing protein n=1 Tax=Lentinula raphanica TaxID=153919 RepID=A0AA38NX74_9AGAR|nr:hypothetical protein F5878DRAFT_591714 [Lentinula raphanica]